MTRFITLISLLICCTAQAATDKNLTWEPYKTISLSEFNQNRLNTKLKLLELVSERQWDIINQTPDSFEMSLRKCHVQMVFSDKAITINHVKEPKVLRHNPSVHQRPKCMTNWLSNIAKDINTTLKIIAAQQEAIALENNRISVKNSADTDSTDTDK
ncbi:hypothetical protein [Vibrio ezurae]|uniref:Uncharacterized protein n=1 Tax=Vibrio ezurae NBRC 102218 TaxID=1219080 RepID=U3AJB2_9VIBR|nr:hypothetical protein [Vibrio ezurae]GAD80016.1 hypothetical protein VEZ01S_22_00230 [Vibrio ezurae NBRC 102218]